MNENLVDSIKEEYKAKEDQDSVLYEFTNPQTGKPIKFFNLMPHKHLQMLEQAIRLVYQQFELDFSDYFHSVKLLSGLTVIMKDYCKQIIMRNSNQYNSTEVILRLTQSCLFNRWEELCVELKDIPQDDSIWKQEDQTTREASYRILDFS